MPKQYISSPMNIVQKLRLRGFILILFSIGIAYIGAEHHFATKQPGHTWGSILMMLSFPLIVIGLLPFIAIRSGKKLL